MWCSRWVVSAFGTYLTRIVFWAPDSWIPSIRRDNFRRPPVTQVTNTGSHACQVAIWFERKFESSIPVELLPNLRATPARLEEVLRGRSHTIVGSQKFQSTFSQKDGPIKMLVIILDRHTVKDRTALPSWRLQNANEVTELRGRPSVNCEFGFSRIIAPMQRTSQSRL